MAPRRSITVAIGIGVGVLCVLCLWCFPLVHRSPVRAQRNDPDGPFIGIDLTAPVDRIGVWNKKKWRVEVVEIMPRGEAMGLLRHTGDTLGEIGTFNNMDKWVGRRISDIPSDMRQRLLGDPPHSEQEAVQAIEKHYDATQDAYTRLFRDIRKTAEEYLGTEVTRAVVAIPNDVDEPSRQLIKDAGEAAGLYVGRVIRESLAAVLAHEIDKTDDERNAIVYTLHDGFNVQLLNIDYGFTETLSSSQNVPLKPQVGGSCGNTKLQGIGGTNPVCEDTGLADILGPSLKAVDQAISNANLTKADIHHLLLAGSSPLLPNMQDHLEMHLGIKASNNSNCKDAVLIGSTIQALVIFQEAEELCSCCPIDYSHLNLGFELANGIMDTMLQRHSYLPQRRVRLASTAVDNQTSLLVKVYQGQRTLARDNDLLGTVTLDIPPLPRGAREIEITFELDMNYLLGVTVKDTVAFNATGEKVLMVVPVFEMRAGEIDLADEMVSAAEKHHQQDQAVKELLGESNAVGGRVQLTAKRNRLVSDRRHSVMSRPLGELRDMTG